MSRVCFDGLISVVVVAGRAVGTHLLEATAILLLVLPDVLLQRILIKREGRDGPVQGRNVDLVDGLGVRGGQAAHRPAVEGA